MADNQLPLNKFRVITKNLISGSNIIYQENQDATAIVLSTTIANITGSLQTVTVQLQKSGSQSVSNILYNAYIPVGESLNPLGGKLVLEKNDALIMKTNQSGSLDVILSVLENSNN